MEKKVLQRGILRSCLLLACLMSCHSLAPNCLRVTVEENFYRSDIVFTGSVQSKSEAPEKYSQRRLYGKEKGKHAGALEVLFEVETTWKGKLDKTALLYTVDPKEDGTAGYHFEVDGEYVVFARFWNLEVNGEGGETETNPWTELCSQNINLEKVESKNSLVRELAFLKAKLEISEKKLEKEETSDQDNKATELSKLTSPPNGQEALD